MYVDEILAGGRAPMAEQHWFHMRESERLFQQRIVIEVELTHRQVVGGSPVGVHPRQEFGRKGVFRHTPTFHPAHGRGRCPTAQSEVSVIGTFTSPLEPHCSWMPPL